MTLAPGAGGHRVAIEIPRLDGTMVRQVLRETSASVDIGVSGTDPAQRALFVDWSEDGQRFFSYSRDRGESWTEAQPVETALLLNDGRVESRMAMPAPAPDLELPGHGQIFLVQFRTVSLPEWRQALEEAGAELLSPFPHNAHIVRMNPAVVTTLAAMSFVQRIEPYHPAYRIDPGLRRWLGPLAIRAGGQPRRVNVVAFEWGPAAKNRIAAFAQSIGARVAANPSSGQLLELWVNQNQLRQIAAHDDVSWVDSWSAPAEDMDLVRTDSGANFIENSFGFCGQGVRGEVMDGGVERTHMDFDGILLHGNPPVASHGTSTYGIVFGNGRRDGDGNAQGTGHLVCGAQGIFGPNSVADRFAHTQELKRSPFFASFQSNSWGNGLTTEYTSISQQMDDIIWRLDIAIVQSQSNDGTRNSRPQAWAKNIISVGGVRHHNTLSESDDNWGAGGSIGPAADGRIKPDVNYWFDSIFTTTTGNGYTTGFGGTSAATPEVAGVLGLMVQMWSANVWGTNPQGGTVFERQPHAATIKALLINNAKQYAFSGATHDLTRTHQGWGRPNLEVAHDRAANSFIVDQTDPLSLNETTVYSVRVPAGETELKVTMTYPDPPGVTSATLHRINDLSLKVTSPSGTVFHGNHGLDVGNFSTPGGSPNTIDTVENVFVQNPAAGRWTVEVRAAEINSDAHLATPEADAVYALVVTGARRDQDAGTVLFEDDFETDKGWVANPAGSDTAVTGRWERGDPEPTDSSGPKQLGTTTSGVNDLVTGRTAGASAGANDIDGGSTSIRSTTITLPSSGDLTLSFNQYFAHGSNSSTADFLRVGIISGASTTTVFEQLGSAIDVDAAWTPASVSLNAFRGQTVRILVSASDAPTGSLVEAGIDDVKVTRQ